MTQVLENVVTFEASKAGGVKRILLDALSDCGPVMGSLQVHLEDLYLNDRT